MFNTFLLLHHLIYKMLCQKDLEKPPSQCTSNCKSINIANIGIRFCVLKFSKEDCFYTSFSLYIPIWRALYKRFESLTSKRMSKGKSRNIANIGIQSYITKFSQKCFILSVYCTALCTERFEPPPLLGTSKKILGHTTNINIQSYNSKFSEKLSKRNLRWLPSQNMLKELGYIL